VIQRLRSARMSDLGECNCVLVLCTIFIEQARSFGELPSVSSK
jgi:hypothetical protein